MNKNLRKQVRADSRFHGRAGLGCFALVASILIMIPGPVRAAAETVTQRPISTTSPSDSVHHHPGATPAGATTRPIRPATRPAKDDTEYADYFGVLPRNDREHIASLISNMELGTSIDEVRKVLGPPTEEGEGDALCLLPREHRSRELDYSIARLRGDLVTTGRDQAVTLWFDRNGRLELIVSDFPAVKNRQTADAMDNSAARGWWKILKGKNGDSDGR